MEPLLIINLNYNKQYYEKKRLLMENLCHMDHSCVIRSILRFSRKFQTFPVYNNKLLHPFISIAFFSSNRLKYMTKILRGLIVNSKEQDGFCRNPEKL